MKTEIKTILCIPGKWNDRSEIITSVALTNMKEYIFMGNILLHLPTNQSFEVEICDFDLRLKNSFEIAGEGRFTEFDLINIEEHTFVVYVIGKGGSQQDAFSVMKAGNAFLNAGGLGLKVETSGKAFTKEQWVEILNYQDEEKFYESFVVILMSEENSIYSCGLHNIGLRDIICDNNLSVEQAVDLLRTFIYYLLFDKPTIISGQTFSVEVDAPRFKIIEGECKIYEKDELFFNPFGIYNLQQT